MKLYFKAVVLLTICTLSPYSKKSFADNKLSPQLKNSIMSRLIGEWGINDTSLTKNGTWISGPGADWNFYPILNGNAIQDDWIAPSLDKQAPSQGRQFGTNIRIYNPKEKQWEMAWISVKGKKLDTFTAIETNNSIIMSGKYNNKPSRITFFNISNKSFDWKLELQQNDKSWIEIYRIKGTKK